MGFLRFDAFCGGSNPFKNNCCTEAPYTDILVAVPGDQWQLPYPATYDISDKYNLCRDGDIVINNFGTLAPNVYSSFIFTFSNIQTDSNFRVAYTCCGNVNASPVFKRLDYVSDVAFMDDILSWFQITYGAIHSYRLNNTIYVQWDQDIEAETDCRCNAILTSNTSFTPMEISLEPQLKSIIRKAGTFCVPGNCPPIKDYPNGYDAINQIQLQGAQICLQIQSQISCMSTAKYIQFNFPPDLEFDCYTICSNTLGCSQPIQVSQGCNTTMLKYRNTNTNYTQIRLGITLSNPNTKKTQEISRSSKGIIRKLYATMERSWELETDYYASNVHLELAKAFENDEVIINGFWDGSSVPFDKMFVTEDSYKINWLKDYPRSKVAKGEIILLEKDYIYVNQFC